MRIRTVKPEFFTHADLADLDKISQLPIRLSFLGLWCCCDREGRFKWDPRRLGVQILPYDYVDFEIILDILNANGYIEKYEVDGKTYGWVPSFHRHQVINNREQESSLPPFQQPDLFCGDLTRESTGESTRPDASKGEGKGRKEEKGKERRVTAIDLPFQSEEFKETWQKWITYRKEMKKPLTNSTIKMQFKKIQDWGEQRSIKVILRCIANSWRGLEDYEVSNVKPINTQSNQIVRKPQTSDNYGI